MTVIYFTSYVHDQRLIFCGEQRSSQLIYLLWRNGKNKGWCTPTIQILQNQGNNKMGRHRYYCLRNQLVR